MKVKSPPGAGHLRIPVDGDVIDVPVDEAVEVDDEMGRSLVDQGWLEVDARGATVAEVLEWVGDDPERASAALAEERAKDDPRVSLVSRLESMTKEDD
jgi:hypothetical protein